MARMLGCARVAGIVPAILIGAAGTLLRAPSPPPRATHTPNAIIGKVTNAAGQPVSGVGVTAIVRAEQQGQTRFNIAMANLLALTDEHGDTASTTPGSAISSSSRFRTTRRSDPTGVPTDRDTA